MPFLFLKSKNINSNTTTRLETNPLGLHGKWRPSSSTSMKTSSFLHPVWKHTPSNEIISTLQTPECISNCQKGFISQTIIYMLFISILWNQFCPPEPKRTNLVPSVLTDLHISKDSYGVGKEEELSNGHIKSVSVMGDSAYLWNVCVF